MVQLFVTFVDALGSHLRIFGQLDRKHMEIVQSNIDSVLGQGKHGDQTRLEVGILCLARRFDKFSRARILSIKGMDYVTVHFIDYGDDQTLKIQELRLFKLPKMLESFPKQVSSFILSGFYCDWKPYHIQEISQDICNKTVDMRVEMEIYDFVFVRLVFGRQDFAEYLINHKRIGLPISIEKLRESFCLIMENQYKVKPQAIYNNNVMKTTARRVMPVRRMTQTNNMNVGYYSLNPMMPPAAMGTVPRKDGSVGNPNAFTPPIMGMNTGNFRMPLKAPENRAYYPKSPERTDQPISPKRSVATFKSNTLMVGKIYDVYCCYVENGPCSFSVHLRANEDNLNAMMTDLENMPLKNLTEKPSLGMACIARFSEDGQLYRAVIMSIKPTACQVAYVDYGNTEIVSFPDLYEIPTTFLDEKVFAIRFALSGYKELEPIDETIKNTFTDMVLHQNLRLKVMPLEGPPLVQYCELYDGKINILDALKNHRNKKLKYPPPETLHADDVVVICYVESPKKFFVQKVANTQSFEQMMDDLFLYCKQSRKSLDNLSKGTACAVKFENAWYRAEITGSSGNRVSIRHVDFGNERKVDPNHLCSLTHSLVQFPPQAVQCCLKGFENTETLSESATVQMEMLAESDDSDRRHFKCQIFKIEQDGIFVVNLIDSSIRPELNLMKRLYKLSMPFNKYIGLEKEEIGIESQPIARTPAPNDKHMSAANSTTFVDETVVHSTGSDWDSGNVHYPVHRPSSDCGSSGSGDTRDTRNSSDSRSKRNLGHGRKPFKENNRREQPYTTFKGKNLPPRFQKQGENNRRFKENKFNNNTHDKSRSYSSETSGKFSQYSGRSSQYELQKVQYEENWDTVESVSSKSQPPQITEEYLPPETSFLKKGLDLPVREDVTICWWISPHQFYTHMKSRTSEFENMMKQMQIFYKNKAGTKTPLSVGSNVIARYREDNILYRAKIIASNQSLRKYRVEFVDFGNQSTAGENDIYLVEKRFSTLPVMAYLCAFENVISNFDHNYITSKVEHYLKSGNSLSCEYLKMGDDDLYYVNVEINGNSLKELMIKDGLLSALDTDMKLEMLSGQQIKAKILSITDLLNFKIEIEGCSFELLCSYNDIKFVKSNPQLSSEFKKGYEGASCIVDVVDVTGEKILMLQPHIALFTNELPSTICNYPILYQSMTVRVAYVLSENIIYVRPVLVDDVLAQLLYDMCSYYDTQGEILTDLRPGMLCASNYSGKWYRARITTVMSESVEVYYIDYGSSEVIDSKENFKVLENSFYNSSALAVGIYLPLKSINDKEEAVIEEIRSLTNRYELTLHMIERYKSRWIGDISSNGYSLINVLEDKTLVQGRDMEYVKNWIDHESVNKTTRNEATIQKTQKPEVVVTKPIESTPADSVETETQDDYTKTMISAYLSHCDNPGRFFLHLTKDFDELTKLQDNIQIVAGSLPPLMRIVTGAPCIALYSVDDTWYRAKVIDNEIMAVQFIDYGNTDVITDSSYIKEMNEAFAKIEPFAVPCSLTVAPKGTVDWIDEANALFNESFDKTVYFNYVVKNEKKNFIDLVVDGQNVAEKLINEGLARQLETVKSGQHCFVSHINSLSDFYIQMESDADALELIAGHLAGYENFPVVTNAPVGIICAALFPEDGEWYRAKTLTQTDEGIEVLFIDYGNTSLTTEVRHISNEIASLPFLSKKCSLRMPENILGWSDLAEDKFAELSGMGQTVFVVELAEPGDHAIIDLYVHTRNILEDLEPLCDKRPKIAMDSSIISEKERLPSVGDPDLRNGIITQTNSPMNFYVRFTTDDDQLFEITDFLNSGEIFEKLENPQVGDICVAVFDDGALYRAKVLSISEQGSDVFFIDFGNISTTTEFFVLPDKLKSIDALVKCCALENLSTNVDFSSEKAVKTFNSILDSLEAEILQFEIVNQVVDPWIVRILCKNISINKELMKSLAEKEGEASDSQTVEELLHKNDELALDEQKKQQKVTTDPGEQMGDIEPNIRGNVGNHSDDEQINPAQNRDEIQNEISAAFDKFNLEPDNAEQSVITIEYIDEEQAENKKGSSTAPSLKHLKLEQVKGSKESSAALPLESLDEYQAKETFEHHKVEGKESSPIVAASEHLKNEQIKNGKVLQSTQSLKNAKEDVAAVNKQISIVPHAEEDKWSKEPSAVSCGNINQHFDEEGPCNSGSCLVSATSVNDFQENKEKESVTDSLISEEANTATSLITEKTPPLKGDVAENRRHPVLISHVVSPKEFYVQEHSKSLGLKKVTDLLESAQIYEKLTTPVTGSLCVANSPDDGGYYRAKILSIDDDTAEVYLIDYGNKVITGDLRELPEDDLSDLEPVAVKCSLADIPEVDLDDQRTVEMLNTLMESHFGEAFEIQILGEASDAKIVKLFLQQIDIGEKLHEVLSEEAMNKFRKVFICHTNSHIDFYIQFTEDIPLLNKITDGLKKADEFEIPVNEYDRNKLYAAKFPDDGEFYRVKILTKTDNKMFVRSVDFGNTTNTEDIRILPDDLHNIRSVANHCTLENSSGSDFFTQSTKDLFCSMIASHLNETFQAEIINDSSYPWVIKLYHQGNDLREKLIKAIKKQDLSKKSQPGELNIRKTTMTSAIDYIAYDENKMYSSIELGQELWKGYLGLPAFSNVRAASTSNISLKTFPTGSASKLSVKCGDTRSKSSDCLHVTAKK